MEKPKVLVCINALEKATFLPTPIWQSLENLESELYDISSENLSAGCYRDLLEKIRPEVIVTAWSTPRLPADPDSADQILQYLRLQTHLAGSLRFLPRIYLEKGLKVTNWGNSISRTVAECALMLVLCCLRHTARWQIEMHCEKTFNRTDDFLSLFERRVGLYGFGRVGQALVDLLAPFNVRISAYDANIPESIFAEHKVRRCGSAEQLFGSADVIINVAPATPAYHHSVKENLLRMLPPDGVFVNVGRGETIDESVLAKVAQEGQLRIGLDVFETEPLPADSPLRGLKNVCLLPHIGGPTADRRCDAGKRAVKVIATWLKEQSVASAVCLQEYERAT